MGNFLIILLIAIYAYPMGLLAEYHLLHNHHHHKFLTWVVGFCVGIFFWVVILLAIDIIKLM